MPKFLQLHILTAYGPSCLNRDDAGRPKTAVVGGVERLRISSQSLKRAWRTSEVFEAPIGTRMRGLAEYVAGQLSDLDAAAAKKAGEAVAKLLSTKEKAKDLIMLYSPRELERAVEAGRKAAGGENLTPGDLFSSPFSDATAADVALWGRMLAAEPSYNVVAACSVAHAVTTHRAVVEDDYFVAVSDIPAEERTNSGSEHIGSRQFGAGLFYTYVVVDRDLLMKNLNGDAGIANAAIEGLIRAATTVSPGGMSASYGSFSPASYVLAEAGNQQPRSLIGAFYKPVRGSDQVADSIKALGDYRSKLEQVYGAAADATAVLDVVSGSGSVDDLLALAREAA